MEFVGSHSGQCWASALPVWAARNPITPVLQWRELVLSIVAGPGMGGGRSREVQKVWKRKKNVLIEGWALFLEEKKCCAQVDSSQAQEGGKVNDRNQRLWSKSPAFITWKQRPESILQRAYRGCPVRGSGRRVPWSMVGCMGWLPGQMDGLASGCSSCCFWSFHINNANVSLGKHLYQ